MKKEGTFLGRRMAQTDKALWLWESILIKFEFARLVEIGTYKGNFSFFLYLYCLQRKKEFITYDVVDWKSLDHKAHLKNLLGFDKCFRQLDIFKDTAFLKKKIQEPGITVIFCDGGDKVLEFNTVAPLLKLGDIIAIHDFGTEVKPERLFLNRLRPFHQGLCEEEGMTRFYERYV